MGCKIYTKLQKSAATGGTCGPPPAHRFLELCLGPSPASLRPPAVPSVFCSPSLVLQGVDVSADLERWSQFDVHTGHQVILGQQQQRLAVDLLQAEGLGHVTAA